MHEAAVHPDDCVCGCRQTGVTQNCFITLTYSDKNLPKDRSVDVEEWKRFAKRVRKNRSRFRYLHCGEYGDTSLRPHYHALLFGYAFERPDWELFESKPTGDVYVSRALTEEWGLGHCTIADLTPQTAGYVARYAVKKLTGELGAEALLRFDPETGEEWSVKPAYLTMSRRPGLGDAWYKRYHRDVFPSDEVLVEGKRVPVPTYYRRRLEVEEPEIHAVIAAQRRARAVAGGAASELIRPFGVGEMSSGRLLVKEGVKTSRLRNLTRGAV